VSVTLGSMSDQYRSAGRLAWVAIFAVASAAAAHVTTVLAFGIVTRAFPDLQARAIAGEWWAGGVALLIAGGTLLSLVMTLLAGVAFLSWLYRVVKNTRLTVTLRSMPTPGGAVAVWFIPIVSLFRPYDVMRTVYRANDAEGRELASDWVRKMPWLMPAWWGTWLLHLLIDRIGVGSGEDLAHTYNPASFVGLPFTVVSALGAIAIVQSVQARQEATAAADAADAAKPEAVFEPPTRTQE